MSCRFLNLLFCRLPNRRGARVRTFSWWLLGLIVLVAGFSAVADEQADRISALEKLVEAQNQKIEALTTKVKVLEEREHGRTNQAARLQLPTIIIDTNGVPVNPPASHASTTGLAIGSEDSRQPPKLTIGAEGFSMSSGDTNFVLRL